MWSTLFTIVFAISVVLSLSAVIINSIKGETRSLRRQPRLEIRHRLLACRTVAAISG